MIILYPIPQLAHTPKKKGKMNDFVNPSYFKFGAIDFCSQVGLPFWTTALFHLLVAYGHTLGVLVKGYMRSLTQEN